MAFRDNFNGIVRGLPQGAQPIATITAHADSYPYTEQISYTYTQTDITEPGYWQVDVDITQDREASGGSQWGPFTLTISYPGCQNAVISSTSPSAAFFDILLKKYPTVSQLSDGTNSYWIKDIDARELIEKKANLDEVAYKSLSNVSTISNSSAVKIALDTKVNKSDIWFDSSTSTLNIGVSQS